MKLRARNVLSGNVVETVAGAVTSHVRREVAGTVIASSITNKAIKDLGLVAGYQAYAAVKANDVMIGKD